MSSQMFAKLLLDIDICILIAENACNNKTFDMTTANQSKLPRSERKRLIMISKKLSWILRHKAKDIGLHMRNDGYVEINALLNTKHLQSMNVKFEDIEECVKNDSKQRYSMKQMSEKNNISNKQWFIRANQGHSLSFVNPNLLLTEISIANNNYQSFVQNSVCHGTYFHAWKCIQIQGLSKMKRNMIHFAPGDSMKGKNVISGMRSNCEILIYINLRKCLEDGILFYISDNNVILSNGIDGILPTKYFEKVTRFEKGNATNIIWDSSHS